MDVVCIHRDVLIRPKYFGINGACFLVLVVLAGGCASFDRRLDVQPNVRFQDDVLPPKENLSSGPIEAASTEHHNGESVISNAIAGAGRFGKRLERSPCWYGNYLGPGNCGYDILPVDALDDAARIHDMAYDLCHADGSNGAFLCLDVGRADLRLAGDALRAWPQVSFKGKMLGLATAAAFAPLGMTKVALLTIVELPKTVKNQFQKSPTKDIEKNAADSTGPGRQ